MKNLEIIEKLKDIHVNKRRLMIYLKNHYPNIYNSILENTSFLSNLCSFAERLYCVRHNLTSIPLCKTCHKNQVKFNTDISEYRDYCSQICQKKSSIVINKRMTAIQMLDQHAVIEKAKQTRLQKQNEDPCYKEKIQNKRKSTNLERYGNENYVNIEKIKETKLQHKNEDPNYISNMVQKIKETKLQRYGNANYNNIEQLRKTNLKNHGVEYSMQCKEVLEKSRNTSFEKYGVTNNFHIPKHILKKLEQSKIELWKTTLSDNEYSIPQFTLDEFLQVLPKTDLKFKCKKCGNKFISQYYHRVVDFKCKNCFPIVDNRSQAQSEIFNFLKSIYKDKEIKMNVKGIIDNYELDIYILDKKLAIEFDGLYWHSDARKENDYHLKKTELCELNGIHLIHIFEDEWEFKRDLIKSKLEHLLGLSVNKIQARKCNVKEIDNKTKSEFLIKNHIQGDDKSKIKFGLYFQDELVAVATFSKSRYNKRYEYEIIRYATKLDSSVIGGFGKLLKAFENTYHPKSIVSYADRRWTQNLNQNNLYYKNGFELVSKSQPNYFYVKNFLRESRIKYQKHKLPKLLKKFDPNKTEVENMRDNGYWRIFDCGNLVFEKLYW